MKVVQIEKIHPEEDSNYNRVTIVINDKERLSIGGGEPEDMSLSRDLSDVYNIVSIIEDAYNAGVMGEPLELYYEEE